MFACKRAQIAAAHAVSVAIRLGIVAIVANGGAVLGAAPDYYHRGMNDLDAGALDRAMAEFDDAIKLDPRFARAYCGRLR
jgi:Tfp pilus assembly protein PilF